MSAKRKFTKRQIEQRETAGRARWAGVSKSEHSAISRKGLAAAKGIPPPAPGEACATCGTVRTDDGSAPATTTAELVPGDAQTLSALLGVKLDLLKGKHHWTISRIVVPDDRRGGGVGTRVMEAICAEADAAGKIVALSPSTHFGGSSKSRLAKFYSRFGFIKNKGGAKDYEISEEMYRLPSRASTEASDAAVTYSHTSKPSENEDEPGMTYDVMATAPDGKVIGTAYFGEYDGALRSGETEVDPSWRRKGVASGMYDYLEKVTGRTVEPSPVLSEYAKAFWDARRARKDEKAPKMAGIPRTSHAGDFASKTLAVASGIGPEGRWGSDRVYLASLYEALPEPRPDRAIWEQGILGAAHSEALRLAGGEYVGDMDASLYRLSEVHDGPRALRFLVTPSRPVGVHPPT